MKTHTKALIAALIAGAGVAAAVTFALRGCKTEEERTELAYISAVNAVSPVMPDEDIELLYSSDFFFDRLDYSEQKVYINMLRACREMKEQTYFDPCLEDTFLKAEYALFADHPEITWRWSYSGSSSDTVDTVYFDITDEEKKERNIEAVKKADEAFAQVDPELSDYEKMLVFYDKIIEDTDYAENDHDQDMTSVFLDKESVCAGYSRAFQYLCKKAGIECAYIEGKAYGFQNVNEEAHAWNLVKLDDKYYWVDVTWGDPVSEDEKYDKTYSYFCAGDEEFFKTHDPAPTAWRNDGYGNIVAPLYVFEVPECTDSSKDYYKLNGAYFEDYDRETISKYIGDRLTEDTEAVVEFKMGDSGAYYSAVSDLFEDRVYVYDIIEYCLGSDVAESRDVFYIQDDETGVISLFLE